MSSADVEEREGEPQGLVHGGVSEAAAESTFHEVDDRERITPAIEFRDVTLSFDDRVVLDRMSFKVRKGETKIILGGSGGGKSTTIKLILGLLKPDEGRILVDGEDITDYTEVPLTAAGRKALKAGTNVIAIHCHQTGGGQYIDAGLVEVKEAPRR